eukprot:9467642-Pyramimonas_sp.AAC.1
MQRTLSSGPEAAMCANPACAFASDVLPCSISASTSAHLTSTPPQRLSDAPSVRANRGREASIYPERGPIAGGR